MKAFLTLTATALLGLSLTLEAEAAARAWVSSTGTDSGTCLVATPCRTFQYAHDHLDPGGEIDVKDPGGYGPLNITKAMSVVADGVLATASVSGTDAAVRINAAPNDVVLIRGLTINGLDPRAGVGFFIQNGKVTIDSCSVKGMQTGILITGNTYVVLNKSIFTGSLHGIYIDSAIFVGLKNNIVAYNTYGITNHSSFTYSYGDNTVNGNSSFDISGTVNRAPLQ